MARPTPPAASHPTDRLLGDSVGIRELRAHIRHLATFDTIGNPHVPTLLIQGETGTGKGLIARVVHDSGPRAAGPFVGVNCAALPESLLEAEVLGFEAGAFTDAKHGKPGLFEAASGGALFLDEIDALPLSLQSKLLTVVEEKRVRRLGAVVDRAVDVKLIVATQRHLSASVDGGQFRADLYHRLAVVVLTAPPLCERGDDIVTLARHFLQGYAAAHHIRPKQLSAAAEVWLRNARWPGNVRELRHLMERVTLLCPGDVLDPVALAQWDTSGAKPAAQPQAGPAAHPQEPEDEPARIRQALLRTGGNITRAARLLGLSRKALRYRLRRYGIERPDREASCPPPHPSAGHDPPLPSPLVGEDTGRRITDDTALPPPLPSPASEQAEVVSGDAGGAGTVGISLPAPSSGWEQRTVAVLAIELTLPQSTRLAGSSHEPWVLISRWEGMLADKIREFGGVFLRRSPPLLVAGFGLPRSLEQMPHRAVQTALAIRHLIGAAPLAAVQEPCPEVRLAVHLGPVLVDMAAPDPSMRLPAVGDTLALPMRLLGHAAPGEILLSPQAARLVEEVFALQARELHTGKPDASTAYTVAGLRRRHPAGGAAVRTHGPFVGRERELAVLHDLLALVEGGQGQVVSIVGEPGMGKSRLLGEFRRRLSEPQVMYMEGRCFVYSQDIPYQPMLEILRQHCGITEVDPLDAVVEKVRCCLQSVGVDPNAEAPYLLHMLGVKHGIDQIAGLTPEAIKARTFEALCQTHLNAHRQQPLLLAVEDIHWIDDTSAEYMTSLAERLAGAPILLLCTHRPGYQPAWMHRSYATRLTLKPLPPRDGLHVVRSVLQTGQIPDALAQAILAKAEGNPFFLEELAQTVTQQGALGSSLELPETIQGALMARIDSLSEAPKRLVQTMAVVGTACPISLLTRITDQPSDELLRLLSDLQRGEFLYEQPAIPEPKYLLKHALTQEVAYHSLARERRLELHGRIAQAIEAVFQDRLDEYYGVLARHYQHSGDMARAALYLQRAGQQAIQRSAIPEAAQHLTTGLNLLAPLPETPARVQQELDMLITLGPALIATKGYASSEVEETYARARTLCSQVGDTPQIFPVLRGLCAFYLTRGALPMALELGQQLDSLVQRETRPTPRLESHDTLGGILFYMGDYAAARMHLEQVIALTDPATQHSLALRQGVAPGVRCLAVAAITLWCLGYSAQAVGRSQEALALAQELGHPPSLALARLFAAVLHHRRREVPAVQTQAEALMSLATAQQFPLWAGWGTCWRGWALALQGQGEAGMAQMRDGLATVMATGQSLSQPFCLTLLAEAAGHAGRVEEGLCLLAEALTALEASGRGDLLAEAYRLRAELLLRQASGAGVEPTPTAAARAEACLQRAMAVARRQQAKSWELRTAMSLSRLWQGQGKRDAARELLAPIYAWFSEGFDAEDLREGKALLHALGCRDTYRRDER